MIHWVDTHGLLVIVGYLVFAALVGSMPALPDGSGYWARWGYAALHALSMNLREALTLFKLNVPEPKKESGQ